MMDNYQAMNFYYGLLNLRAGFFKADLCEILMAIAQSVPDKNRQSATAYHTVEENLSQDREQLKHDQVEFGSFYQTFSSIRPGKIPSSGMLVSRLLKMSDQPINLLFSYHQI